MGLDVKAMFEFFADNPPSILIAGGFLCVIFGAFLQVMRENGQAGTLIIVGLLGIVLGVAVHLYWLKNRR